MRRLSDFLGDRDNNINLIRFVAAGLVLFAHSFIVVAADRHTGPLVQSTGHDLGYHAVDIFFTASGLLIAQSWNNNPSLIHYGSGRLLRLWPALFICALFVTFVAGPVVTILSLNGYFHSPLTYKYLPHVMNLVQVASPLPGVYTTLPGNTEIDGPLWTLKYEVICYIGLAAFGYVGGFRSVKRFLTWTLPIIVLLFVFSTMPVAHDVSRPYMHLIRFGFCFGLGVGAFVLADRMPLTLWIVAALGAIAVAARYTEFYYAALWTFTAYTTLWFAYVPRTFLLGFNKLGDYSYGIYIYAYPIQQMFVSREGRMSAWALFALAFPTVLLFAFLSWHFIEKPSLASKRRLAEFVEAKWRRIRQAFQPRLSPTADLSDRDEA